MSAPSDDVPSAAPMTLDDDGHPHPPTVSVGMPVFNGERFIEEAIGSLLDQTFEDFDLVIVDNNSTDRTYEICQSFVALDDRVRYVRHRQNYGFVHNFNTAFRLSSGRYFKWSACDDVCAPEFLARCVEALDRDPTIVLAYSEMPKIDEGGNPLDPRLRGFDPAMLEATASEDPADRFTAMMHNLWYTEHLYGLIRSSALARTRLHAYHPMGDHVLLSELSLYGRFHRVREPLLFLRRHTQQTSKTRSPRLRLARLRGDSRSSDSVLTVLAQYPKRLYLHASSVRDAPLDRSSRARCYLAIFKMVLRWTGIRTHLATG